MNCEALIRTLDREHRLSGEDWERLFTEYTPEDADFAIELARQRTLERELGCTLFARSQGTMN